MARKKSTVVNESVFTDEVSLSSDTLEPTENGNPAKSNPLRKRITFSAENMEFAKHIRRQFGMDLSELVNASLDAIRANPQEHLQAQLIQAVTRKLNAVHGK